jgi:8-oxo-dGTP pyrophosphatase MutT (NUDIX family)
MLATLSDLPSRLAIALRETVAPRHSRGTAGLSGSGAHPIAWRMSPELSYGRHNGPKPNTARAAAVMLLLFRRDGRWHLPLTQRPAVLVRHGGQISLPGGRIEPNESAEQAARRELAEELGVAQNCNVLGRLPDRYVFASDYVVSPFVAATVEEPHWRPDAREVERIVELPADMLLDPQSIGRMAIRRGPLLFHAPCFVLGEDRVWGATCVILAELADALRRVMG